MKPKNRGISHCACSQALWMLPRGLFACLGLLTAVGEASEIDALADLSLAELMNEKVTSVSKRLENRTDAAAAIAVLTREEIVRSPSLSIPDLLRTVPGVNVAAVNAGDTALSIRGFNNVFANKLLVLVDGRTVYTPAFGGVYWDLQQPMLEDLDRIEVIRGPGATVWGANAVNGVINIVSRNAQETQGGLLYVGGGDVHSHFGGVRYGGQVGAGTYYRVFASAHSRDDSPSNHYAYRGDGYDGRHAGFRMDHFSKGGAQLTWQGDFTEIDAPTRATYGRNINTLGRWTQSIGASSTVEFQAYFDRTQRDDVERSFNRVDTFDITAEHAFELGTWNKVIWGTGYRVIGNEVEPRNAYGSIVDNTFSEQLVSAFLQNEWTVVPDRLTLTAGTKLEHNDYTGFEVQPSVRGMFKPSPSQTVWAAISRAVRTPSQLEGRNLYVLILDHPSVGPGGGLYAPVLLGNPKLESEVEIAYETGYRIQAASWLRVDLALFYQYYKGLIAVGPTGQFVPGTPYGYYTTRWENEIRAHNTGVEVALNVQVSPELRLEANYTFMTSNIHEGAVHPAAVEIQYSTPRHQGSLTASWDMAQYWKIDSILRYVSSIPDVPSYLTADLRVAYQINEHVELAVAGRNLFDKQHREQFDVPISVTTEVARSLYATMILKF